MSVSEGPISTTQAPNFPSRPQAIEARQAPVLFSHWTRVASAGLHSQPSSVRPSQLSSIRLPQISVVAGGDTGHLYSQPFRGSASRSVKPGAQAPSWQCPAWHVAAPLAKKQWLPQAPQLAMSVSEGPISTTQAVKFPSGPQTFEARQAPMLSSHWTRVVSAGLHLQPSSVRPSQLSSTRLPHTSLDAGGETGHRYSQPFLGSPSRSANQFRQCPVLISMFPLFPSLFPSGLYRQETARTNTHRPHVHREQWWSALGRANAISAQSAGDVIRLDTPSRRKARPTPIGITVKCEDISCRRLDPRLPRGKILRRPR